MTFYRRGFGRGMGHGRRGGLGLGPGGYCVCPNCGKRIVHQRGVPCYQHVCPECGTPMVREGLERGYREEYNVPPRESSTKESKTSVRIGIPKIDKSKCLGCGDCASRCPFNAIRIVNGKAELDENLCRGCRICISACPEGAIS